MKTYYDFDDVLILPKPSEVNSRSDVNLEVTFLPYFDYPVVPIMAANMDSVGTFETARVLEKYKMITALHKFYTVKDFRENEDIDLRYIAVSCGGSKSDFKNLCEIMTEYPNIPMICMDVANGYTSAFREQITQVKREFPKKTIVAGNVATYAGADLLTYAGADIVKLGIGSGALCRTRTVTGVGVPQFSLIQELSYDFDCISDGGIREYGDVAKAFGAGADFVMIGSMFAAHRENSLPGTNRTTIYGMSSRMAHRKYYEHKTVTPEGITVDIPIRGYLSDTIEELLGALRSTLTYTGHSELTKFIRNAEFIHVNRTYNKMFEQ